MPTKSWLEVFLVPFVIAVVGVFSTQYITRAQLQSAERLAQANSDNEDRRERSQEQIKILEIFSDQFKSEDPGKRTMGVRLLSALEPELAGKLAVAVAASDPAAEVRAVAVTVAQAANDRGNAFAVIASLSSLQQAKDLLQQMKAKPGAPAYPGEIYLADNGYYALTYGGHLSYAEANRRVQEAKKVVPGAYVRQNDRWGANLAE